MGRFFFFFVYSVLACDLGRSWRDYVQSYPVCCPRNGGTLQAPLCTPPRPFPRVMGRAAVLNRSRELSWQPRSRLPRTGRSGPAVVEAGRRDSNCRVGAAQVLGAQGLSGLTGDGWIAGVGGVYWQHKKKDIGLRSRGRVPGVGSGGGRGQVKAGRRDSNSS